MSCKKDLPVIYDHDWHLADKEIAKHIPSFLDQLTWSENETVMDHGCGTGRNCLKYLVPRVESLGKAKIYAVDKSRGMIEFAQEKYPHLKVTYTATDLLSPTFPYNDVAFDKICSFFVICVIGDGESIPTLKKMYELLAPGGFLILLDVLDGPHNDLRIHLKDHPELQVQARKHLGAPDRFDNEDSSAKAYRVLLENIGFKISECKVVSSSHVFESTRVLAEFLMGLDPVPHEAVGDAGDHYQEYYAQALELMHAKKEVDHPGKPKGEGEHKIKYKLIYIMAEKPSG